MSRHLENAKSIVQRLVDAGHEAYFAGGCVRDALLGVEPNDYDVATSATPDDVQRLFRKTVGVGRHFGVMIVVIDGEPYDVATFRSDGAYGDGRRPDSVAYSTAEEDVRRRDFTINGLLMDPRDGRVVDHVGGVEDLRRGVVRTIGAADERFGEDHLRILRAVRFAARFGFTLEPATEAAVIRHAALAATPSAERIAEELDKMFTGPRPAVALDLLERTGLLPHVLPEVAAKKSFFLPSRLGGGDAYARTRALTAALGAHPPRPLAWAVLLEDSDPCSSVGAARALRPVTKRLRFPNRLAGDIECLVALRDRALFATRFSRSRRRILLSHEGGAAVERYVALEAKIAAAARSTIERGAAEDALPAALVSGDRLIGIGVPKGRGLGRILRRIRWLQLEGRLDTPEAAEVYARNRLDL